METIYNDTTSFENSTNLGSQGSSPMGYILQLLVTAFLLVGNFLVLLTLRHWTLVNTGTKFIFAYVALAHILFGISSVGRIMVFFLRVKSFWFCIANNSIVIVSTQCSISATALLSSETMLALAFPLKFKTWMSLRNEKIMIVSSAVVWVIFGGLAFVFTSDPSKMRPSCHLSSGHLNHGYTQVLCLMTLIEIILIAVIQVVTAVLLRKRFLKQKALKANKATSGQDSSEEDAGAKQRWENLKKIQALSRTVSVMAACYTIAWGPVMTNAFIASLCYPEFCQPFSSLTPVLSVPVLVNCSINIITYAASNLHFRMALLKLLRCKKCLVRVHPEASQTSSG